MLYVLRTPHHGVVIYCLSISSLWFFFCHSPSSDFALFHFVRSRTKNIHNSLRNRTERGKIMEIKTQQCSESLYLFHFFFFFFCSLVVNRFFLYSERKPYRPHCRKTRNSKSKSNWIKTAEHIPKLIFLFFSFFEILDWWLKKNAVFFLLINHMVRPIKRSYAIVIVIHVIHDSLSLWIIAVWNRSIFMPFALISPNKYLLIK